MNNLRAVCKSSYVGIFFFGFETETWSQRRPSGSTLLDSITLIASPVRRCHMSPSWRRSIICQLAGAGSPLHVLVLSNSIINLSFLQGQPDERTSPAHYTMPHL